MTRRRRRGRPGGVHHTTETKQGWEQRAHPGRRGAARSGPGYPLAEQRTGEPLRVRPLPVAAACGLAVRGDRLLLFGGFEPGTDHTRRRQVHHCLLRDDGAVITGRAELCWPNGDPVRRYTRPIGRGPHVYLRNSRSMRMWYTLSVPD